MANEQDLKSALTRLVGGQKAEHMLVEIREDRALTPLEKKQIAEQGVKVPLTQQEQQAILAYLKIQVPPQGEKK
jgi:hypothetical protein